MNHRRIKQLTIAAMIAAVYLVITLTPGISSLSYGPVQIRFAEVLTVLPYFLPAAVPGLFIGCLISNFFSPNVGWDVIIGSLSTLMAAFLTYKLTHNRIKRKWLAPLPPVLINAVVVGAMLGVLYELPILATMLSVGAGQLVACYVIGFPLILLIEKNNKISELFKRLY